MKKTESLIPGEASPRELQFEVSATFAKEYKTLRKKYPSIPADVNALKDVLKQNPFSGESLGDDCYKIRIAISGKHRGKSGGGRVIICVKIVASIVYLVSIYDKAEQETISLARIRAILKTIFG